MQLSDLWLFHLHTVLSANGAWIGRNFLGSFDVTQQGTYFTCGRKKAKKPQTEMQNKLLQDTQVLKQ